MVLQMQWGLRTIQIEVRRNSSIYHHRTLKSTLSLKVLSSVDLVVVEIYTLPALEVQTKERRQRQNESPVKVYFTISLFYMSG